MYRNAFKLITTASLLMGAGILFHFPARGTESGSPATTGKGVAKEALKIVSGIHSSWPGMPGNIVTGHMTSGALIGNGSVGVAIGGSPDRQEFYVGRDDFWSILRGRIMPVGRLLLSIPALHGASSRLGENIGVADATASLQQGRYALESRSWVAIGRNIFAVQLQDPRETALPVSAELLDGYGHKDQKTLSGTSGDVHWLRVSPEVVRATIGGPDPGTATATGVRIRSVQVFTSYLAPERPSAGLKPRYVWRSSTALAGEGKVAEDGETPDVFSCGDIIMPQHRFTVRASISASHTGSEGAIFSSLVGHRWFRHGIKRPDLLGNVRGHDVPRVQGARAGLILYLTRGRLSADLNGTVVTANRPAPLNQWLVVSVAYNGMKMVLRIDGAQVGETDDFPTTEQVMGSKWEWAATHPGDQQIPFDGCAPTGILAMRVIGAPASERNGEMNFVVPSGGHVTLLVAAMDDRDTPEYFHAAISDLEHANANKVAKAWLHHLAWWRKFWSKSFIEIPYKAVQAWWYGSLYLLASCSRPGNVAPGLWGNWITSTKMGWQGDYTLDYNYEALFYAAFPTNHVSLADPYDAPLLAWIARGRGLAKEMHDHGLIYYCHLAPSPGWSADNFRALDHKGLALFAAVDCIQRWRYTQNATYARKVWPFLTGVADFWDHDLRLVNGRYVDFRDTVGEHMWGPAHDVNPAPTIGFLRMLYPALIEMSYQLHTGQDLRSTWRRILTHLSTLPIAPADKVAAIREIFGNQIPPSTMVLLQSEHNLQWMNMTHGARFSANPAVKVSGSSGGMDSMLAVFPGWNIGLESSPALRHAAVNTVNYMRTWYDYNDTSSFYPAAAGAGYNPDSILKHLYLLVTHIGYPNFAYNIGGGGVENEATVPTTICAMLLQSYQRNIHVFADWPKKQNASFGHLLACGDFLVSSKMSKGRVLYVRITSQHGGQCRLANPWDPDHAVHLRIVGKNPMVLHGAVLRIPTRAGERLLFTPLPQ